MDKKALEQYLLTRSLNMGLGSSIQGETSYTNSFFDIKKSLRKALMLYPAFPPVI